jgi:hypothetical protein
MNVDEYRAQLSAQEELLDKNKELMRHLEELQDEMMLDDRDSIAWIEAYERLTQGVPGARREASNLWDDHYTAVRDMDATLEEGFERAAAQRRSIEDEIAAVEQAWRRSNAEKQEGQLWV